jgi:colanic acid/amylovoran biosynthesis glycosyltransferase
MSVKLQKRIGLFVPTYLNTSETFIYSIVSGLSVFQPVIYSRQKKNLTRFPVAELHCGADLPWYKRISLEPLTAYGTSIRLLKKTGIRLIHAQFGPVGIDLVPLKEQWPAMPLITHFRGQDIYQLSRDILYRLRLQKLFQVGDLFLTVSAHLREYLIEQLGCPEKKVEIYYGGIDIKKTKFKVRDLRQGRGLIKLLMCGRMTEKKGFEYGIKAFFELLARGFKLSLEIIGTGPLETKLKKQVAQLRLEKFIKFLGPLGHADVLKKMHEADILLAPYVAARNGDSEGIPNILKEALASGLPVVSTRHTGVPEIIIDGVTGFLVNEKAVIMLSRKLEELIKEPGLAEKFAVAGRTHVEKLFDNNKQIVKLEKIYNKLIS